MFSVFGLGIFCVLFFGVLRANARRWRYLAKVYAKPSTPARETRSMQSAVLLGLGGLNSLKGIVTIGVHETGVSLRILAPFSLFHSPLFIPYADIRGWRTTWYLDARSTELEFRGAPEVKMVVPAEQAKWIHAFSGHELMLRDERPPQGNAGRGWHALGVAHAAISLVMIAWLAVHFLSQ